MQKEKENMLNIEKLKTQVFNEEKNFNNFDKYLSLWVAICIILGTVIGYLFPKFAKTLGDYEVANVSILIAVVLLIMMFPIMLHLVKIMKKNKEKFNFTTKDQTMQ